MSCGLRVKLGLRMFKLYDQLGLEIVNSCNFLTIAINTIMNSKGQIISITALQITFQYYIESYNKYQFSNNEAQNSVLQYV